MLCYCKSMYSTVDLIIRVIMVILCITWFVFNKQETLDKQIKETVIQTRFHQRVTVNKLGLRKAVIMSYIN